MKKQLISLCTWPAFLSVILLGCKKEIPSSPESVLSAAIQKIRDHPAIQYQYHSHWDNRFNGSTFADSAEVIYSRLDSSRHGFGFFANAFNYKSAHWYDGFTYKEIRHPEKQIVGYDSEEIAADSMYFSGRMFFFRTPFEIREEKKFDQVWDTLIDHTPFFVYQQTEETASVVDSTKTVRNEMCYFIDIADPVVRRIKSITIIDGDTAQIIEHFFSDLQFDAQPYNFNVAREAAFATYTEVSNKVLENEQHLEQIAVGDQLTRSTYVDIQGREIALYGTLEVESLIMFSFIGCGGCEYAMNEMKKKDFKIRENLHFFYSSPVDINSAVQSYLDKKAFPFGAFSKESNMNEEFSVYSFPTFVRIDSEGKVTQVMSGYSEEEEQMIFGQEH